MNFIVEGTLLGLTLGTTCLVTCAPVYGSLILSKENSVSSGVRTVIIISLGRFISYAVFGLLTGFAGSFMHTQYPYDGQHALQSAYRRLGERHCRP